MVKTKKKEVQKQGLRPSQKAKAEKLRQKQATKAQQKPSISPSTESVLTASSITPSKESKPMVSSIIPSTEKVSSVSFISPLTGKMSAELTERVKTTSSSKRHPELVSGSPNETTSSSDVIARSVSDEAIHHTIHVKNADGNPDTVAEILIQNKINYTPKVSVVMPVYNVEPYFRQCLDSVINQTLKEIEIICVDDGSTDASLDILKEYAAKDNRITVITQKNLYAGVARNVGLSQAKGKYLSFLDSDDFFELTLLEETYNLAELEQSQIVFYQYQYYNNELQQCEGDLSGITQRLTDKDFITLSTANIKDNLFSLCNPMPWNKLISRQLVVDENLHFQALPVSNDVCFSLNVLACANQITLYYKSLVYYRYNRKDSLRNTRDKAPLSFYEAYKGIYNTLKAKDIYEKYKKTYLNALVATSLWTLDNTEEKHEFVKKFIKDEIIPTYIRGNEYLIDEHLMNRLRRVYHPEIIVSLTSYPARINTVSQTIESLLNQSMKADKVILWLAPEQFPHKEQDLPQDLLNLVGKGLIIDWYHDIRSYKKLIPTLKKYPNAIVITADDDALYDKNWLYKLYKSYLSDQHCIHCHRAHKITLKHKKIDSYKNWQWYNSLIDLKGYSVFFTGLGGVLYPPHIFSSNILDEDMFMKLCPQGDDIWFWGNAVLSDIPIRLISDALIKPRIIDGTQDSALWVSNKDDGQNDEQIQNMVTQYPEILKKVIKENDKKYLKSYLLFPYNLIKAAIIKKWYRDCVVKQIEAILSTYRVDVKNFGDDTNDVKISASNASVKNMSWDVTQGKGKKVEGATASNIIKIKAVNDGLLKFDFKGPDKKFEGKRIPLWIDYQSIKINGKEILLDPIIVWHDTPYRYELPVKDGDEVILEIKQQKHKYTKDNLKEVLQKLNTKDDYIKNNLSKILRQLRKKFPISTDIVVKKTDELEDKINSIISDLTTYRVDIKNFGNNANDVEINAQNAAIDDIKWNINQGNGKRIEGTTISNTIKIKAVKNGLLKFDFREQDKKFKGKLIPLWIDYKSIKINGKEILSEPVATWHNRPYHYEMPVKDGQEIMLEFEQQYHQYSRSELKSVILKLYANTKFVKDNIEAIVERTLAKVRVLNGISLSDLVAEINHKKADNTLTTEDLYSIAEKIFDLKNIKILSKADTIKKIKENNLSISRFGDGEIRTMFNPGYQAGYQKPNPRLTERLKEIFVSESKNILICMDFHWANNTKLREHYQKIVSYTKYNVAELCRFDALYGNTNITRDAKYVPSMKEIWQDKDIVIVEGELSRLGVGNDLFDNVKSAKRILCPAENAFDKYNDILRECKKQPKDKLFLIALGSTATILAYDLAKLGYQALDVGHIDIVYEWHLRGATEKIAIPGKYTNEAAGGTENIEDCTDLDYLNSIIAKVA